MSRPQNGSCEEQSAKIERRLVRFINQPDVIEKL